MNLPVSLRRWLARGLAKGAAFSVVLPWVSESALTPTFRSLTYDGYRKNGAFFACVSALAMSFPEPPLGVWDDEGADAKRLSAHPLRFLLRRPNPLMGEDEMAIWTIVYMAIGGNAYWHKVRDRRGQVVELWPYHAGQISPVPGGPTWISGYEFDDGAGHKTPIPTEDVVHFKWPSPDPTQPWMAQPPLLAAAREVDTDNEATRYLMALLRNDAVPRTMILTPADSLLDTESKRRLKEQFARTYGGDGRGDVAILDGGATVQRLSLNLEEMAFEALHRIPEARIASAMRVPPIVAGLNVGLERSTYSNYGEAVTHFTTGTLVPLWRIVASEVEADLGGEFPTSGRTGGGVYVRHDLSQVQALQEDEAAKWQRVDTAVKGGYLTVNQALTMLGQQSVNGGDVFLWPSGVTPVPADRMAEVVASQTDRALNPPPPPTPPPPPGQGQDMPMPADQTPVNDAPAKLLRELRAARREVARARKTLGTGDES